LLTTQISEAITHFAMSATIGASGSRRAVAYIRVARDVASSSQHSERARIESWAARAEVDIASWQVDVGVDAMTPIAERPGLLAAYRAISEERAGILVAANAEQFSLDELVAWLIERAALTQGAVIETADGSRAPIRTAEQVPAPRAAEEDVAYTRGAIELARAHQRVSFRERMRASAEQRRSRGLRVGNVPYGYKLAADGLHLEANEAEQAVIRAVHELSAEGRSQRGIASDLEVRGVVGRTGAPLRQTQIANILRSA